MADDLVLSIDAMGGDHGPLSTIDGVRQAKVRFPQARFLLYGDEEAIKAQLTPEMEEYCEVHHTPDKVGSDQNVSQAVRTGRKSSMWLAIKAVKDGEAHGVVSAGNTGALMAMAKLQLRTLPGISRPAIATLLPTMRGETVMLDLGANSECDAQNLVDFAIMGEVFCRAVLGHAEPLVGILNIGSEEQKGHEGVRQAADILRKSDLRLKFHGFVEGDDIGKGATDVVVTDGFTGNVALKTAEGTAKLINGFLKEAFASSWLAKMGYLLARPALRKVRRRTDPRRYNGAMFLGLKGICVKSHGGTDALGFSNAVGVACDLVSNGLNTLITEELTAMHATQDQTDTPSETEPKADAS